jgi:hypothetical protein
MIIRFEVAMAANIKMAAFWVIAPCSLVKAYQHFRDSCCLHHQSDGGPEDGRSKYL